MEIGTEISQKIRSAIKAKLVELGAYVDDELPDYIMVMVANKKTRQQMADDLSLFLGMNTETFTTWLAQLLEKLQAITADPPSKQTTPNKDTDPKSDKSSKKDTDKSKSDKAKDHERSKSKDSKKKDSKKDHDKKKESDKKKDIDKKKHSERERKKSKGDKETAKEPVESNEQLIAQKDEEISEKAKQETEVADTVLTVAPEIDEFSEEARREQTQHETEEKQKISPTPTISTSPVTQTGQLAVLARLGKTVTTKAPVEDAPSSSDQVMVDSSSKKSPTEKATVKKPQRVIKTYEYLPGRVLGLSARQKRQMSDETEVIEKPRPLKSSTLKDSIVSSTEDRNARKRKSTEIGSTVGSVIRHNVDDDEDFDRRRVGAVASVIHVSERKSSIPKSLQANKSLILKAVDAATSSVANPSMRRITRATRQSSENEVGSRHDGEVEMRRDRRSPRDSDNRQRGADSRQRGAASRQRAHILERLAPESFKPKGLTSRSSRQDPLVEYRNERSDSEEEKDEIMSDVIDSPTEKVETTEVRTISMGFVNDSRKVERIIEVQTKDSEPESPEDNTVTSNTDILMDDEVDDYLVEDDLAQKENVRYVQQAVQESKAQVPRAESPRFIVTLDGVDPRSLTGHRNASEEDSMDDDSPQKVIPQTFYRPLAIAIDSDSEGDGEYEGENHTSPRKKPRMSTVERCKFWPGCKNGSLCPYQHPTTPCKTFPNCTFGDKCLYVHPSCKFDAKCTRADCPFTHSTKHLAQPQRGPVAKFAPIQTAHPVLPLPPSNSQNSRQTNCKFYPECTNMNCPFNHPKMCRYGVGCGRKDTCSFTHPKVPTGSKLKWKAGQSNPTTSQSHHISERKFVISTGSNPNPAEDLNTF
ncbi:unnamed protein product [Owenia fusiformis]|uniref:Zinc finger CCCH domain-containing protein 14 n=1 Tax=Owenia fusiformis TaxID=6347 RepID=A0A8J1U7U0_OWEFU|nr:unnamed protein product [Owenia fusiformis]